MKTRDARNCSSVSPVAASTSATAVTTRCSRPRRSRSMERASAASAGLPSMRPSSSTTVSAPTNVPLSCSAAEARAFARARNAASCSAVWPGSPGGSGASDGARSNTAPNRARMSRRRGEAEASTIRLRASSAAWRTGSSVSTLTHSTWWVCGNMSTGWTDSRRNGPAVSVARSLASVSGSHETYTTRPGGEAMSASSVPGRHPARGGSSTTASRPRRPAP